MKKTLLLMVALLSLALAGGCARGGNGIVPIITVNAPSGISPNALYPTEPNVKFTAAVSGTTNTTVTWSLIGTAGTACTGTPNPCGTIDPTTGVYQAPAAPVSATVKATLTSDSTIKGGLGITVVDVTTDVAPATLSIGQGLTQTFTAVAVPDDAATQHFTWTCTVAGVGNCANFVQDPTVSGLAHYTAQDTCNTVGCVQISAITPLDANGCSNSKNCTVATASLVPSRVNGTYAFRFSGYDASHHATAVVGTFTAVNGTITSGTEDELTSFGPASHSITGTYTPISSSDPNSNNAGTLALTLPSGVYPNRYRVVLDGAGDLEMIESDSQGTGSGIARMSSNAPTQIFKGNQTFAFGFTGVDSGGSRVGYVGLLPMDGAGNVAGGLIDVNDNGNSINSICGTPPCTVTGKYSSKVNGSWSLALTSPVTMNFDFFIASVTTSKTNPLTFYAISTDSGLPAVSGTMVLQDSTQTYNNAAFNGTSITALTGTVLPATATCAAPPCANVSLTLGTTDGNGNFSGLFDQNNAGAILSAIQFPPSSGTNNYTYAASSSNNGRYTFNLLGDPTATTVVAPLPFVLYASGANRGFLLEQGGSSPPDRSVMTGTMSPQGKVAFGFPGSALPGTFAAATTGSGSSAVDAIAANLLLTWVNTGACTSECVSGTQYDANNTGGVPLAGTYSIQSTGNGTITLGTAPSTQNFVIYALDTSGCTKTTPVCAVPDFLMMDVDQANPNASIIFAQQ